MAKDSTNSGLDGVSPGDNSANPPDDNCPSNESANSETSMPDPQTARAARLAAIKAAVEAGKYDTDEMLEIALNKMIQRLPTDRDE